MGSDKRIFFDPFSLDLANECLWKGPESIKLRPKAFAVINYLLGHPGQLVTKQELLNTVWPETFVGDAVLKVAIRQLREALGDSPKSPRFIETAHRRGYRFIAQIRPAAPEIGTITTSWPSLARTPDSSKGVVGRDEALSRMQVWLERVTRGERQIIFVTGEAGIGKTALVDTFVRSVAAAPGIRIASGQCLEQYGTSEAFLPVLDAIGRLCRESPEVVDTLRVHAPMWLLQMPSLLSASERESLSREMYAASRERMLRAMGEALDALTERELLVLILEDLHWSDYSTLDLISYLATRRQPTRLMLIGTYRPVDLIVSGHPLKAVKQELFAKQQCEELPLQYLSESAVGEYLSSRFPVNRFPAKLAELIHQRTEGNPLFMINIVEYLVAEGLIIESENSWKLTVEIDKVEMGVPDGIKQMIEKQVEHLSTIEQRTLEAASVAGAEFSTLALAAGLREDPTLIEARCDDLTRRHQFIEDRGVQILPNAEAFTRYGFVHALYQNVLYERVPESKRIQLHRRIGERGEEIYGERAREIAGELAMHFERGSKYKEAVRYLQQAADNAIRRFAYREAVGLAQRGLDLIQKLPNNAERIDQELCIQLTLGVPLIATEGYAAPEVGNVYLRARELCRQLGPNPNVSEALWGLWTFHTLRSEFDIACEIAEEFLSLAERHSYPGLALRGHWALEIVSMHRGDFVLAKEHYEKALSVYEPERHLEDAFFYAQNPGVAMRCFAACSLWFLGQPEQALVLMQETLAIARELSEPHGLAHALFFASILHQLRREAALTEEHADAAIRVSREHGLAMYQAMATITQGWALSEQEQTEAAIKQMCDGIASLRATGTELMQPHFMSLLAEAFGNARRPAEGLEVIEEAMALIRAKGEQCYLAEAYRIKAELLFMQAKDRSTSRAARTRKAVDGRAAAFSVVEDCFNHSIRIAQAQKAKSCELRTLISLWELSQHQSKRDEVRRSLEETYGWFTEGFDTVDLTKARTLLDGLSTAPR